MLGGANRRRRRASVQISFARRGVCHKSPEAPVITEDIEREPDMQRIIAGIFTAVLAANGLAMLFAGRWWYGAVPGVSETGPFNPHFVKDIGAAYLVCGAALAWRAARRTSNCAFGAVTVAAGFLTVHALIHIFDEATGSNALGEFARDFPGVFLPAIVAVWVALPARKFA